MSGPENFLSRWSRRKRVAEAPQPPAADAAPATDAKAPGADDEPGVAHVGGTQASPEPAFDPESLPPLDSIGADTDISAFLKPGVPGDLKLAALRRAWSADPAIRDFVGLQENDWDFNDPTGAFGFGNLPAGTDVKKMLGQLFGEAPPKVEPVAEPATEPPAAKVELALPSHESDAATTPVEAVRESEIDNAPHNATPQQHKLLQREENIAAHEDEMEPDDAPIKRRRSQGSALPQ